MPPVCKCHATLLSTPSPPQRNPRPAELCFRCGQPGHKARDCPSAKAGDVVGPTCVRCGSAACPCAGKGDYFRLAQRALAGSRWDGLRAGWGGWGG